MTYTCQQIVVIELLKADSLAPSFWGLNLNLMVYNQVDLGAVCAVFPYGMILPIQLVQPGGLSFQVCVCARACV